MLDGKTASFDFINIFLLSTKQASFYDFDQQGYHDPEATKKKVLTNVFKKGDAYFRSGDILIRDEFGWLYFKDRSGDTFRFSF